jgi:hypothetical protein
VLDVLNVAINLNTDFPRIYINLRKREANISFLFNTKIKNSWNCFYHHVTSLHGIVTRLSH